MALAEAKAQDINPDIIVTDTEDEPLDAEIPEDPFSLISDLIKPIKSLSVSCAVETSRNPKSVYPNAQSMLIASNPKIRPRSINSCKVRRGF
ncbi:hypothetical protein GcC1_214008 [Golovinomyces cichoracearum]|uniref:Uncharacterized protein n=1 Tax=Golovinomyces cichoracearum TaxID=62708 RepID=A0A420H9N5_9PEZI|nr:hypothetical protein GcC1_214008 [Golovinomyces cichoracearum]